MKKLIDLYNLGEKEGVEFLNIKMERTKGLTNRSAEMSLIVINLKLGEKEEYLVLAHEMGHFYKDCFSKFSVPITRSINEAQAHRWKATYLVPRAKYIEAIKSPFVGSDFEMAEELGIDIGTLVCVQKVFTAQGLPISKSELGFVNREP